MKWIWGASPFIGIALYVLVMAVSILARLTYRARSIRTTRQQWLSRGP